MLIDFSYKFDMSKLYDNTTQEYALLNTLTTDNWITYLDAMAASGVTVEYWLHEDAYAVWGHQTDPPMGFTG